MCHGLIGLYLQLILSNTRQPPSHSDQLYTAKQSNTVTATFFNFQISWEFLSHSSSDVANDMAWGASFPTRENIKKKPRILPNSIINNIKKLFIYLLLLSINTQP
jgi:hypothetical protein